MADESKKNGLEKHVDVDTSAVAIVVRIASQAGPRAIEMQFGVPLDMNLADLNAYMDKATSVIDRQAAIGDLRRAKLDLEGAEKMLATTQEQRAAYESKCALDWTVSGRKGEWRPVGAQKNQFDNWDTTLRDVREKRIPGFKAEIARLEREIAGGQ